MKTAQEIDARIRQNEIAEEEYTVNWVRALVSNATDLMYFKFRKNYPIHLSGKDYTEFEKALENEKVKKLLEGFSVAGDGKSVIIISLA